MKKRVAQLAARRVRTALGLSFGLVIMYGAFYNAMNPLLLSVALGFALLHLFGDCYNDGCDYDEDKKNGRKDKLTVSDIASPRRMVRISLFALAAGLAFLLYAGAAFLALGAAYAALLWAYSSPRVRLKGHDIYGYALTESPWLLVPPLLNVALSFRFSAATALFMSFFFFQYLYLLCQKDSTDTKDATNLFIRRGWRTASIACIGIAAASSASLLMLSAPAAPLLIAWALNLAAKIMNLWMIWLKKIGRSLRGRLVLIEFATPYLYAGGGLLA